MLAFYLLQAMCCKSRAKVIAPSHAAEITSSATGPFQERLMTRIISAWNRGRRLAG